MNFYFENGKNPKNLVPVITESLIMIIVLQGVRRVLLSFAGPSLSAKKYAVKIFTMIIILLLAVGVFIYAKLKNQRLHFFPYKFSVWYIIAAAAAAGLYAASFIHNGAGVSALILLIYGSLLVPVYEETIFRGYLWRRFAKAGCGKYAVCLWSTVLYTVWNLFFIVPLIIDGDYKAALVKLVTAVAYGIVLGILRIKVENCFLPVLLHGVLNLFFV